MFEFVCMNSYYTNSYGIERTNLLIQSKVKLNPTPRLLPLLSRIPMQRRQTFSLFVLLELVFTKKVFYPILLFPTYSPQASSPLERSRQTDRENSSPPVTQVFFFLSARGPTRRRNSTGLAELWGGWPND